MARGKNYKIPISKSYQTSKNIGNTKDQTVSTFRSPLIKYKNLKDPTSKIPKSKPHGPKSRKVKSHGPKKTKLLKHQTTMTNISKCIFGPGQGPWHQNPKRKKIQQI